MPSHWFGLIELLLVFGAILGWAGWQWWDWRKWRQRKDQQPEQPVPPDDDGPGV